MTRRIHQSAPARDDELDAIPEPANLRFLRRMVTLLTVTMIVGIAVVAGALVMRIAGEGGGVPMTEIRIGPGYTIKSVDHGAEDRLIVVLKDRVGGEEIVRVYRTEGPAEAYTILED